MTIKDYCQRPQNVLNIFAMDIYPLGHSCFRLKGKTATLVTDPFDTATVGLKLPKIDPPDIITISHQHHDHNNMQAVKDDHTFIVNGPGEYEVKEVFIIGLETDHDDKKGAERGKNVIYKIIIDDLKILHLGDLGRKLTDEEVNSLGSVDILLIPVGGTYTIDAKTAGETVAQIEPRLVIPMHYGRPEMKSDLAKELAPVSQFLKEMGVENIAPQPKLSLSVDKLPESTTVVVLE